MSRYTYRMRGKPVQRPTDASRALASAHAATRFTFNEIAKALGVVPRTVRRWELGEAVPRAEQWPKVLAFYAKHAPDVAEALAVRSGHALPAPARARHDRAAAERTLVLAADAIDVAPKRVREVLRALVRASQAAGIDFERFAHVVASEAGAATAADAPTREPKAT